MIIGVPKEIKVREYRVGLTPDNVAEFVKNNHAVIVEKDAGAAIGFNDADYKAAGATILNTAEEVWKKAEMIVKVKEPIEPEYDLLQEEQILFTYLHLAADEALTKVLLDKKIKSIAYETILNGANALPCLKPMSQIAGRLAVQQGVKYIEKEYGGRGLLLMGVPGVPKGNVVIIGGGIAGTFAAKSAIGLGANVTIIDRNVARLEYLDDIFGTAVETVYSTSANITNALKKADLVIGTVLIPGAKTPQLVKKEHLDVMKKGAVLVDVAIDQGGTFETSHVTTHDDPIFIEKGIIHYCVGNMPGAVPLTSTLALTNSTLSYGLFIANKGFEQSVNELKDLMYGVNTYAGKCTNKGVCDAWGLEYTDISGGL